MAILGFLTGTNPERVVISRDADGAPGLTVDAVLDLSPSRTLSITKNPVESGGEITDHATVNNLRLSMQGLVSETPLPFSPSASAAGIAAGVVGGAIGTKVGGGIAANLATTVIASSAKEIADNIVSGSRTESQIGNRAASDTDFPRKAWDFLLGLQKDRELLKIKTRFREYTSMVIADISAPQKIENGRSIFFNAVFEQIQIVRSIDTPLPENLISADASGGASKTKRGQQASATASSAQSSKVNRSLLDQAAFGS